jgi:hypothetical protein
MVTNAAMNYLLTYSLVGCGAQDVYTNSTCLEKMRCIHAQYCFRNQMLSSKEYTGASIRVKHTYGFTVLLGNGTFRKPPRKQFMAEGFWKLGPASRNAALLECAVYSDSHPTPTSVEKFTAVYDGTLESFRKAARNLAANGVSILTKEILYIMLRGTAFLDLSLNSVDSVCIQRSGVTIALINRAGLRNEQHLVIEQNDLARIAARFMVTFEATRTRTFAGMDFDTGCLCFTAVMLSSLAVTALALFLGSKK